MSHSRRYFALDSLRGVCACLVALFHFKTLGAISNSSLVNNGFLFVDFFFVLSGFVIATSYEKRLRDGFSLRKFMLLRLGRVYPLHAFMLAVFLTFEIFFVVFVPGQADRRPFTGGFELSLLVYSFFLVQTFFGPDGTPWNGPSWSIVVEVWTYLVFGLIFRFAGRWSFPIVGAIAFVAPLYLIVATDRYLYVFHDGALARCLYGFAIGVFVHWIISRQVIVNLGIVFSTFLEFCSVVALVYFISMVGAGPMSLAAPWLFLLIILVFSQEAGYISRLLLLSPMLIIGKLSFSIYLIHVFIQYRMFNIFSVIGNRVGIPIVINFDGEKRLGLSPLFGDIMSIIMLLLIVTLASLSFRFVEEPGRRWSRRILGFDDKA